MPPARQRWLVPPAPAESSSPTASRNSRGDLFGAQKVFVRGVLQVFAFERNQPLVAGRVRPLVDRHGEMTAADQRARIDRPVRDGIGHPLLVEAGKRAHVAGRPIVDNEHPHRPVGLRLQDEAALEFQHRAKQHGEDDGLAEQLRYRRGIIVARQYGVDRGAQTDQTAA